MGYKHNINDVLSKGSELLRTTGYHQVGINDILAVCGIPKGSFYNFFKSKEHFAQEILKKYGAEYHLWIKKMMSDENLTPLERIKSFYSLIIDMNEQDSYSGGCLLNNLSNEIARNNENIGQIADDEFNRWIESISKCIEQGQEEGEIRNDFKPIELAEYLHTGIFGTFPRMKATKSRKTMDNWFNLTFAFIEA